MSEVNAGQLKAFIERIECVDAEISELKAIQKDIYAEACGNGFDVKIMRRIIAIRKQDAEKRREEEEILDLYMSALGMLADTPLGDAAIKRAVGAFGTPSPLAEEERAKGYSASFVGKDGGRVSFGAKVLA